MTKKNGIRNKIFLIWREDPGLYAKNVEEKVKEELGLKKSRKGTYPSRRLVQHYIKQFRDNLGDSIGEDQPWSVLSMSGDVPPEGLPAVLEVWAYCLLKDMRPLTIRQAKWVARLSRTIPLSDIKVNGLTDQGELWEYAMTYAAYEQSSIALGKKAATIARGVGFLQDVKLYEAYRHRSGQQRLTDDKLKRITGVQTLKRLGMQDLRDWPEFNPEKKRKVEDELAESRRQSARRQRQVFLKK